MTFFINFIFKENFQVEKNKQVIKSYKNVVNHIAQISASVFKKIVHVQIAY